MAQLSAEQRYEIGALNKLGMGHTEIMGHTGIDKSVVSRELNRNSKGGAYETALAAARNRGMAEVALKNEAQKNLLETLDKIADALDLKADSHPTLLTGAGFSFQQSPIRFVGQIATPEVLRVNSTGRRGEIRVQLSDEMPSVVLIHAMEYSQDKGSTWQNGTYHNRSNFVVGGLPAGNSASSPSDEATTKASGQSL